MIKVIVFTVIFALFPLCALSSDWSLRGGPALSDGSPSGKAKIFTIRKETHELYGVYSAIEGGGWVDNRPGHSGSAILKGQLGVNPGSSSGVYGKAFAGVCGISATDVALGGHFQFCEDFGFGVRDDRSFMGITYSHISSAGLAKPNLGRDWITFEIGLRRW